MTAFVNDTEHGRSEVVFHIVGGDSGVKMRTEAGRERMLGCADAAVIGIQLEQIHQIFRQLFLLINGEVPPQAGIANLLRLADFFQQRYNVTA